MLLIDYEPIGIMEEYFVELDGNSFSESSPVIGEDKNRNKTIKLNILSDKATTRHGLRIKVNCDSDKPLDYPVNRSTGDVSISNDCKYPKEARKYLKLVTSFSNYAFDYIVKYYNSGKSADSEKIEEIGEVFNKLSKIHIPIYWVFG